MPRMKRSSIREAIVVEGRDDVTVVEQAVDTLILATHGFGITAETWGLIEKAYNERGIIILTDPDFSGEEIRRRLTERFPRAKQAYLPRQKAIKGDDIGVENATPVDVLEAIESAHATKESAGEKIEMEELVRLGLTGIEGASEIREAVSDRLGIGRCNSKAMLRKLNGFGIGIVELEEAVEWVKQQRSQK